MESFRLMIMAKPGAVERASMLQVVRDLGLDQQMGSKMFDPINWHQSLSDEFPDSPEFRATLRRACGRVAAAPFTLSLNRIIGGETHWAFKARGTPKEFSAMLAAIRVALKAERITDVQGHTPHVTLCYKAPSKLPSTPITPIDWVIEDFLLVRAGGKPYRYEELGRWSLKGDSTPQLGFGF